MSELSAAMGGSAPKHVIVIHEPPSEAYPQGREKRYPISLVTQNVKVAYEKALFRRALDSLAIRREFMSEERYNRLQDELGELYERNHFAMGGKYAQDAINKPGGSLLFLSIMMGTQVGKDIEPLPEIEMLNVMGQAQDQIQPLFRTILRESFPGQDPDKLMAEAEANMKKVQSDPKA